MAHEGERYCCVVVTRDTHRNAISGHLYEVRCDCGTSFMTTLRKLRNAESNMCVHCKGPSSPVQSVSEKPK